jgi:glycosyltransferase involved in cell wall biosynthesis
MGEDQEKKGGDSGMKVVVSLRAHRPKTQGGMGDYIEGLIPWMGKIAKQRKDELYLLTAFFNHGLYKDNSENIYCCLLKNPENYFEEIDEWINRINPDVVFYPLAYPVSELVKKRTLVTCIQDLQHEFYKNFFSAGNLALRYKFYDDSAIYSKRITTLSEHSKSTISEIYNINPERIDVVSPALDEGLSWDPFPADIEKTLRRLGLQPGYLFYPANFWPHKNHEIIFRALKKLQKNGINRLKLVLTGQLPPKPKEVANLIAKYELKERVIHLGYVDKHDLPSLYWGAAALIFPSYFEGFGIPILEAFKSKCPVIASKATSIPEVAGDGALYFDPNNEEQLTHHILTILGKRENLEDLLLRGLRRLEKYSYKNSAENLWDSFEKASKPTVIEVFDKPFVSVVTPSFNQGKFIREAIESVLQQDYPHVEYWVIDGGSTDETQDILRSYGNKIQWLSEKDNGQTQAINKGFARCSGTLLAYLNSDDKLYPGAISRVVQKYLKNPGVSVFYGQADWIDEDGRFINPYNGGPFTFENLHTYCIICQPASVFTSLLYKRLGGFDENRSYAMDYDFWLRAAVRGFEFLYLEEKLAASRLHQSSKTMSRRLDIHREIFEIQKETVGYVHPQWIGSFAQFLCREWNGIGKLNRLIPARVWFKLLYLFYNALPKHRNNLYENGKGRMKGIVKKVFHIHSFAGRGFDGHWVGPDLYIKYHHPQQLSFIELGGQAFFPLILRVFVNQEWVHREQVSTGEFAVKVNVGSRPVHTLRIKANHYAMPFPPIVNSKMSYRLNWCNFFDDLSFPIRIIG